MRRDLKAAGTADAHAFHTVEQSVDQRSPVNSDFRDQRFALVLEPRDADRPPWGGPPDCLALVQPESETNSIIVLAAHRIARARYVGEHRQTRSQTTTKRLPFARKHRRDLRQTCRLCH